MKLLNLALTIAILAGLSSAETEIWNNEYSE